MTAICQDFKRSGFQISDPIGNPNHFQTNLFFINHSNPDISGFQITTVYYHIGLIIQIPDLWNWTEGIQIPEAPEYSGDLKYDHLKFRLFEGRISDGLALAMATAIVPIIPKPEHLKSGHFCPNFKWFLTKWRPFETQPLLDNSKSRLVQISDPPLKFQRNKEMGAVTYFFVNKTLSHDGSHGSTEWAKIVEKFQEPVGVAYHFFISEKQNKDN